MRNLYYIVILILVSGSYYFYLYYGAPEIQKPYKTHTHNDDTIRIAYIGDSWAYNHNRYNLYMAQKAERSLQLPVKVQSYGICGKTSKEVYESLFGNKEMKQFMQEGYNYCVVTVGVNDTYKKMGVRYYEMSIDGIIQFLLFNNIYPIIIDIPDYDIKTAYNKQTLTRKILRQLSMFINNQPLDCKQNHREILKKLVQEKEYEKKLSIISYESWNKFYLKDKEDLYENDALHLNVKGYQKLDSAIVDEITKIQFNRTNIKIKESL